MDIIEVPVSVFPFQHFSVKDVSPLNKQFRRTRSTSDSRTRDFHLTETRWSGKRISPSNAFWATAGTTRNERPIYWNCPSVNWATVRWVRVIWWTKKRITRIAVPMSRARANRRRRPAVAETLWPLPLGSKIITSVRLSSIEGGSAKRSDHRFLHFKVPQDWLFVQFSWR